MTTFFIQDNFECYIFNLLSYTKQLFSSQLEINHVIHEPTEVKQNTCRPSRKRKKEKRTKAFLSKAGNQVTLFSLLILLHILFFRKFSKEIGIKRTAARRYISLHKTLKKNKGILKDQNFYIQQLSIKIILIQSTNHFKQEQIDSLHDSSKIILTFNEDKCRFKFIV